MVTSVPLSALVAPKGNPRRSYDKKSIAGLHPIRDASRFVSPNFRLSLPRGKWPLSGAVYFQECHPHYRLNGHRTQLNIG